MARIEAHRGDEVLRLEYAELARDGQELQRTFQRLYQEGFRLICTCKPGHPVPMHVRRYQVHPPAYCLVTNPNHQHAKDCPRFSAHILRLPPVLQASPLGTVASHSTEEVYANWERSTFYVPTLAELNPAQQEAARHRNGPCMVVAAAGSGKTAVLIARIQYLIESGVDPHAILACTFTRKATQEMRTRLVDVVGREAAKGVTVGTIHAIAYRMLKPNLERDNWKLITDPTWLMDAVLEPSGSYNPHGVGNLYKNAQEALTEVSKAKAEALTPEQIKDQTLSKVYFAYESLKAERHLLDFDDILLYALRFFKTSQKYGERWSHQWKYVLVDEFQDTNLAQWLFLRELVRSSHNLYVIGDDFQSIYGFRGARPDLMRQFQKEYPNAKTVVLDLNYRSHDLILDLAQRVIALNHGHQIDKKVQAYRQSTQTSTAEVITSKTDVGEGRFVADEITRLHHRYPRIPWSEYAVLYRTNAQSRVYEEALAAQDIPYQVVGDSHFYESRDVKVLLDYLRVTQSHDNPGVWVPLLNRPKRFIAKAVVDEVQTGGWEVAMAHPKCRQFREDIENLRRHENPADALRWLLQKHPTVVRQQDPEEPVKWVDSLIQSAGRYPTVPEFLRYVDWVIEKSKEPKDDAVTLSTIHGSKGLEWWTVFVVDLVEGILPHRKSLKGQSLREETRLCYVAITRSKENLYLMAAEQYGGESVELSRYIRVLQNN